MQSWEKKATHYKQRYKKPFLWRFSISLCLVALMAAVAQGSAAIRKNWSVLASQPTSTTSHFVSSTTDPAMVLEPSMSSAPESAPPPEPVASAPDTAADSWFSDALFIGDSRTEGLRNYDGLDGATYYALKGLMVNTVYTRREILENGSKKTVMQAQADHTFGKIYIMLGVNELGWSSTQVFIDDYTKIVRDLKKDHPNAKIYLQAIFPVSAKKSAESSIYKNDKIVSFNHMIETIAKNENVIFLDTTQAVSENGVLPDEASTDGVHLNFKYCAKWCEYLKTHIK